MTDEPAQAEPGKSYPVLVCKQCGHVDWIEAVPADESGQAYEQFQHQCSNCKTIQTVLLSEIQRGQAQTKH